MEKFEKFISKIYLLTAYREKNRERRSDAEIERTLKRPPCSVNDAVATA